MLGYLGVSVQGRGSLSRGVSVQVRGSLFRGLCSGEGSVSRGGSLSPLALSREGGLHRRVIVQEVSVWVVYPQGSLSRGYLGVSVQVEGISLLRRGSLSRGGVSVREEGLSIQGRGSLSRGGVTVQEVSVQGRRSLFRVGDLCSG